MDYEEFLWAAKLTSYQIFEELYQSGMAVEQAIHQTMMRYFRIYMAVGGMPQAVKAFVEGKSFSEIDDVKWSIINVSASQV